MSTTPSYSSGAGDVTEAYCECGGEGREDCGEGGCRGCGGYLKRIIFVNLFL